MIGSSRETGSKEARARPIASQIGNHNLAVLRAPWNDVFINEMREFPFGRKDDQVDALSRAFFELAGTRPPARRAEVSLIGR